MRPQKGKVNRKNYQNLACNVEIFLLRLVTSAQEARIGMKLMEAISDTRNVREISTPELKQQLSAFVAAKFWQRRYFAINKELQSRVTAEWVREDVFGHTFDGK